MATTPQTGTLTKMYISEKQYPTEDEITLIMYTETIPQLRESAESTTYQSTDMESEHKSKGAKKASDIEVPVFYQSSQHDDLKEKADSDNSYWFFIIYPESTVEDGEDPLVKSFSAQMDLTGDEITVEDIIKDTLTLYRNSEITETHGLPTDPSATE